MPKQRQRYPTAAARGGNRKRTAPKRLECAPDAPVLKWQPRASAVSSTSVLGPEGCLPKNLFGLGDWDQTLLNQLSTSTVVSLA
ncbi:hypothetical protein RvY_05776 [Ramazzottius varieornatus]|uniref:Uncharacterized protein n=1 Tax=Ramazzottius varieornatus TaxID=947166 RepID=A0A1D1V574_RAMVA|nr:hypothetical protein RvY_05776 [Ramazzottius varieornatus]